MQFDSLHNSSNPSEAERQAALRTQSQDYLNLAMQQASTPQDRAAVSSAYQAGYFALLSALQASEVRLYVDHPNPEAAKLAANRLGLSADDYSFAEQGAAGFYQPDHSEFGALGDCLGWARRVRAAVAWEQ